MSPDEKKPAQDLTRSPDTARSLVDVVAAISGAVSPIADAQARVEMEKARLAAEAEKAAAAADQHELNVQKELVLDAESKALIRFKWLICFGSGIGAAVLAIAVLLVLRGQSHEAAMVINTAISAVVGALGGYGFGRVKREQSRRFDDDANE